MTPRKDIIRDERGAALIYVVLFMLSSLWFVSLAIDMGKLTVTKGELQRAADAAAPAGASAVKAQDPEGEQGQAQSRSRAARFEAQNTPVSDSSEPVVIDPSNDVNLLDPHT